MLACYSNIWQQTPTYSIKLETLNIPNSHMHMTYYLIYFMWLNLRWVMSADDKSKTLKSFLIDLTVSFEKPGWWSATTTLPVFQSYITSPGCPSYIFGNPRGGTSVRHSIITTTTGPEARNTPGLLQEETHDVQVISSRRSFKISLSLTVWLKLD